MHYTQTLIWQKAMRIPRGVYRLVPALPREEVYGMRSQITRAAVSVAANIAEGWCREAPKDKAHYLAMAQGSLAEADTLLTLCEDFGWFPAEEAATLRSEMNEVNRMLSTMRRNLRKVIKRR